LFANSIAWRVGPCFIWILDLAARAPVLTQEKEKKEQGLQVRMIITTPLFAEPIILFAYSMAPLTDTIPNEPCGGVAGAW